MVSNPVAEVGLLGSLWPPEVPPPQVSKLAEVDGLSWWFSSPEQVRDLPGLARMFAPIGNGSCKYVKRQI